ncbi:MAG: polysaccharide deacetylase family protein [Formivibrio sp.]|nr:polysaccharide deacetylase family protein [Formivibrio sp.]
MLGRFMHTPIRHLFCFYRCRYFLLVGVALLLMVPVWAESQAAAILVYHRFGPAVADSMTTRTAVFEAQLARLRSDGYQFMPLSALVAGLEGQTVLPAKALAITVDDGHRTVYSDLLPIIRRDRLPVALFIYPSAISNAPYAMTWEQLTEIVATGLVEVYSHTYWHPNFRIEKKRLAPEVYHRFVRNQLEKSRQVLKSRLGVEALYLAWPFGIYDAELEAAASAAGYQAAFTLEARHATRADSLLALPRYLIVDATGVAGLSQRLKDGERRVAGVRP